MALLYCAHKPMKLLWFQWCQTRFMYMKKAEIYKKCFTVLGLQENADQNTVRRRYIELVKKVHPDSGSPEASQERFQEVDNAFKILQGKFAKNRRGIYDEEEEAKIFDIKHTAPQHRQYLSFEGIGFGTPSQRQRQYEQFKVLKVQERILEHRVQKVQAKSGDIMKKTSQHNIKTKYGFDRVVEDLIQEAMSKGDFNNLSGAGKPLSDAQAQNPYLDFTTHKLNKILIDNGFTPEWIMLQRDIRNEADKLRDSLIDHRQYLGATPLCDTDRSKWELIVASFKDDVEKINKMIDKFNLIVPLMNKQMFRIKLNDVANDILNDDTIPHSKERVSDDKTVIKENPQTNFLTFFWSLF
ncbi:dnaJ homolog subfamily C member 28 [Hermetia illucens]|nr:dnaJ homolog subfamily C member 28 [Hermetia illucens]